MRGPGYIDITHTHPKMEDIDQESINIFTNPNPGNIASHFTTQDFDTFRN